MVTPIQGFSQAINAYNSAAKGQPLGASNEEALPTDDFADLVKSAIKEAVKIGEKGEQMSVNGITDRADITQVVTAVAEAEVTLQTVIAVRDKVLDAYKDIITMPI